MNYISKTDVMADIIRIFIDLGYVPTWTEIGKYGKYSKPTYQRYIGNMKEIMNLCGVDGHRKGMPGRSGEWVKCKYCGKPFFKDTKRRKDAKYCSQSCVGKDRSDDFWQNLNKKRDVYWTQRRRIINGIMTRRRLNAGMRDKISKTLAKRIAEEGGIVQYGHKIWKKGVYVDKNKRKHIFDSSWEEIRFRFLDGNKDVEFWDSRPNFYIVYSCPNTDRIKRYIPDLIVRVAGRTYIEEIKPKELISDPIVLAKYNAAMKFCEKRGYIYRIITKEKLKCL